VFAVPYSKQLTTKDYTEVGFEEGIKGAKIKLEGILKEVEKILSLHNINYYIPPVAQNNEDELVALFSFKYAAVNAGLGWIGKNDVLITEKYGPRIRLSAVLIDYEFPFGQRKTESRCPESCSKCVDICPHKALYNKRWNINLLRN
jgi:epoxyqueuosine reductase QueG